MPRTEPIFDRVRAAYGRLHHSAFDLAFRHELFRDADELLADRMTWLYAISDGEALAVKIGVAAEPLVRLGSLQVGNPRPLFLVGACPSTVRIEQRFHETLAAWRLRGEWFRECDEVLLLVEFILSGEDFALDTARLGETPDPGLSLGVLTSEIDELLLAAEAAA